MAKDGGEEPMAHEQQDDFLVDGDQLKREQGVGQQHVYPDPWKSKHFTICMYLLPFWCQCYFNVLTSFHSLSSSCIGLLISAFKAAQSIP